MQASQVVGVCTGGCDVWQEEAESTQMKAVEQQQLAEALDKSRRAQLVADLEVDPYRWCAELV